MTSQTHNQTTSSSSDTLTGQIQAVVAEALQLPANQITPEMTFGDLPEWDSMGHMEVMMALELNYNIEINADTIAALTSVPAIQSYLTDNGHV